VLNGQRAGYANLRPEGLSIPGNSGVPLFIKAGDSLQFTLRLAPAPILSGRVVDDRGRPVQGIRVAPYRMVYDSRGQRVPRVFTPASTNDLGEYRFNALDAGEYRLSIETPSTAAAQPNASLYYPVHYPGVADPDRAEAITLESGNETRLRDVVLQSARGATLRLEARNETGQAIAGSYSVRVTRRSAAAPLSLPVVFQSSRGEVGPLAPGVYDIRMEALAGKERFMGTAEVEVDGNDADVVVQIKPSARIAGHVVLEGPEARPVQGVSIRLADTTALMPLAAVLAGQEDGSLRATLPLGFAPGLYFAQAPSLPAGLYVAAIREGSRDVLREGLIVRGGEDFSLTITLGTAGAVQGMVKDAEGSGVAGAVVVLAPEPPEDWHLYQTANTNEHGTFEFSCAPGVYRLYSWMELEGAAYRDPVFMKKYESAGTSVRVEAGSRYTAELSVLK
jgi:hypothetical protein